MRIFIINPGMVDDYVYQLASALSKKTTSVHIFGSNDYKSKQIEFINFNYYNYFFDINKNNFISKFPRFKSLLKGVLYVLMHIYLLYCAKKIKPQIIHFQWSRIAVIDCFFLYFYKNINIVYTMHNTTLNHGDTAFANYLNAGFKCFLDRVSSIIVHTKYSQQIFLQSFEQSKDKVKVVPHGLLEFKRPKNTSINPYKFLSQKVILFFGNIQYYKGLDILINAMYYLKKEDIKLLIVGRSQISVKSLKCLSKKLDVEKHIFWRLEYINEEEVSEIFRVAKAIVLPHRHVDQSGVLMSAINFEIPIIASNLGGFSEIIEDGKNGFLFKKEDPEDLALKIKKLFLKDNLRNMSQQVALLKNNWKSWDEIANDTITIYKSILDK